MYQGKVIAKRAEVQAALARCMFYTNPSIGRQCPKQLDLRADFSSYGAKALLQINDHCGHQLRRFTKDNASRPEPISHTTTGSIEIFSASL
jgi:hypothetical protein